MGRIVPLQAGMQDARFLAALDAFGEKDTPGLKESRRAYWETTIGNNPGSVYLARIDGAMYAGYLVINQSSEGADETTHTTFISPRYEAETTAILGELFSRAGVDVQPLQQV